VVLTIDDFNSDVEFKSITDQRSDTEYTCAAALSRKKRKFYGEILSHFYYSILLIRFDMIGFSCLPSGPWSEHPATDPFSGFNQRGHGV
jgi:hypothetical protein